MLPLLLVLALGEEDEREHSLGGVSEKVEAVLLGKKGDRMTLLLVAQKLMAVRDLKALVRTVLLTRRLAAIGGMIAKAMRVPNRQPDREEFQATLIVSRG